MSKGIILATKPTLFTICLIWLLFSGVFTYAHGPAKYRKPEMNKDYWPMVTVSQDDEGKFWSHGLCHINGKAYCMELMATDNDDTDEQAAKDSAIEKVNRACQQKYLHEMETNQNLKDALLVDEKGNATDHTFSLELPDEKYRQKKIGTPQIYKHFNVDEKKINKATIDMNGNYEFHDVCHIKDRKISMVLLKKEVEALGKKGAVEKACAHEYLMMANSQPELLDSLLVGENEDEIVEGTNSDPSDNAPIENNSVAPRCEEMKDALIKTHFEQMDIGFKGECEESLGACTLQELYAEHDKLRGDILHKEAILKMKKDIAQQIAGLEENRFQNFTEDSKKLNQSLDNALLFSSMIQAPAAGTLSPVQKVFAQIGAKIYREDFALQLKNNCKDQWGQEFCRRYQVAIENSDSDNTEKIVTDLWDFYNSFDFADAKATDKLSKYADHLDPDTMKNQKRILATAKDGDSIDDYKRIHSDLKESIVPKTNQDDIIGQTKKEVETELNNYLKNGRDAKAAQNSNISSFTNAFINEFEDKYEKQSKKYQFNADYLKSGIRKLLSKNDKKEFCANATTDQCFNSLKGKDLSGHPHLKIKYEAYNQQLALSKKFGKPQAQALFDYLGENYCHGQKMSANSDMQAIIKCLAEIKEEDLYISLDRDQEKLAAIDDKIKILKSSSEYSQMEAMKEIIYEISIPAHGCKNFAQKKSFTSLETCFKGKIDAEKNIQALYDDQDNIISFYERKSDDLVSSVDNATLEKARAYCNETFRPKLLPQICKDLKDKTSLTRRVINPTENDNPENPGSNENGDGSGNNGKGEKRYNKNKNLNKDFKDYVNTDQNYGWGITSGLGLAMGEWYMNRPKDLSYLTGPYEMLRSQNHQMTYYPNNYFGSLYPSFGIGYTPQYYYQNYYGLYDQNPYSSGGYFSGDTGGGNYYDFSRQYSAPEQFQFTPPVFYNHPQ